MQQEQNTAYEAGTKLSLFDRKLQINAAAFYYDLKNKQLLGQYADPIIGPVPILSNIPKSRVVGFDLDFAWQAMPGLTLSGALNHSDTKIQSHLILPNYANVQGDIFGNSFSTAPRWSGNANVDIEFPVNASVNFFAGGTAVFNSATNAQLRGGPLSRIKGYSTLDLRAGVKGADGHWEASVWGRNVTNTYYWTNVTTIADVIARFTGRPATYGLRLAYNF